MDKIYRETYRGRDLEDIVKDWAFDKPFDEYTHDGMISVDKYKEDIASVTRRLELLEDAMHRDAHAHVTVDAIPDSYVTKHMSVEPVGSYAYPHVEEVHWSRPQVEALVSKMSELYCKYAGPRVSIDQFISVFEYIMIHSCAQDIRDSVFSKRTGIRKYRFHDLNEEQKQIFDIIDGQYVIPSAKACRDAGISVSVCREPDMFIDGSVGEDTGYPEDPFKLR